jgi:hypothetical protein
MVMLGCPCNGWLHRVLSERALLLCLSLGAGPFTKQCGN